MFIRKVILKLLVGPFLPIALFFINYIEGFVYLLEYLFIFIHQQGFTLMMFLKLPPMHVTYEFIIIKSALAVLSKLSSSKTTAQTKQYLIKLNISPEGLLVL